MKKYYQALLVITAAVSIVSLLFYRHEYNRLRYVLEVFNYFGKPGPKVPERNCTCDGISTQYNVNLEEPISSWQRLSNDLYVYSAYSVYRREVQVIGFGRKNSIVNLKCFVFLENENIPTLGIFKYALINSTVHTSETFDTSMYNGYRFFCTYSKDKQPVGITFQDRLSRDYNTIPILPVVVQPKYLNYSGIAICVAPSYTKPMHQIEMFSFLNFHEVIGIKNFVIYDYGIPNMLNRYLKELSTKQSSNQLFSYATVPWNFPFSKVNLNIMKDIIEMDCLYRTYNKVQFVVTLSWEEYIVLKHHRLLADLMKDYNHVNVRYRLETFIFCMQQPNDKQFINSTLTVFKKTHYDDSIIESRLVHIHSNHEIIKKTNINTQNITKALLTINKYKYCNNPKLNLDNKTYDASILKFKETIESSPMYKDFLTAKTYM